MFKIGVALAVAACGVSAGLLVRNRVAKPGVALSLPEPDAELLSAINKSCFTGTIDYVIQCNRWKNWQAARLIIGAEQTRLELRSGGGTEAPVVCAVANGVCWVVWKDKPVCDVAEWPPPGGAPRSSDLGQLYLQAEQTLAEARLLTSGLQDPVMLERTEVAVFPGGRKELRVFSGRRGTAGPPAITILGTGAAAGFVVEMVSAHDGWFFTFAPPIELGRQQRIYPLIDYFGEEPEAERTRSSRTMVSFSAADEPDSPSPECFQVPHSSAESFPDLEGVCFFHRDGSRTFESW